jgi:hypothetical protein
MKTEPTGGRSTRGTVEEMLAKRFEAELRVAEREYPALGEARLERTASARAAGSARPTWRWLATAAGALAIVATIGVLAAGLAYRPITDPAPDSLGAAVPTQIDGERVYLVSDEAEWKNLTGSFLLGGYPFREMATCPAPSPQSPPPAEASMLPMCGGLGIGPKFGSDATTAGIKVANSGSDALEEWIGVPAVARVHTHDPEAAQCAAGNRADCQAALVVESVVWPVIPTDVGGERVYRAADRARFPTSGSFLLGGRVTTPDYIPPCPAPVARTAAEQALISYCTWIDIGGVEVAPMSNFTEPMNELVVARVHINDPQASQCPEASRADCQAAVVVESVVWRSDILVRAAPSQVPAEATATPDANAIATAEGPGPAQPTPVAVVDLGPDGVPVTYGGEAVARAGNLPAAATFVLAGILGRDTGCAAPTGLSARPPACGYWTVDGLAVGTMVELSDTMVGSPVVVRIQRSKALGTCAGGPCRLSDLLVVSEILWFGGPPGSIVPPVSAVTPPAPEQASTPTPAV